jgi:hypothetical protein
LDEQLQVRAERFAVIEQPHRVHDEHRREQAERKRRLVLPTCDEIVDFLTVIEAADERVAREIHQEQPDDHGQRNAEENRHAAAERLGVRVNLSSARLIDEPEARRDANHRERDQPRDDKAERNQGKDGRAHRGQTGRYPRPSAETKEETSPRSRLLRITVGTKSHVFSWVTARLRQLRLQKLNLPLQLLELPVQHALVRFIASMLDAPANVASLELEAFDFRHDVSFRVVNGTHTDLRCSRPSHSSS